MIGVFSIKWNYHSIKTGGSDVEQIKQSVINKKLDVNTCTIYSLFFSEAVPSCDTFQLAGSFEDTTGDSLTLNGKSHEQCQYECLMKSEVKYIHLNISRVSTCLSNGENSYYCSPHFDQNSFTINNFDTKNTSRGRQRR